MILGIGVSLLCFISVLLLHIFLHRVVWKQTLKNEITICIFILGFILLFVILIVWNFPLPVTSLLLYILLTGIHFIYYFALSKNEVSPSALILRIIRKHKKITLTSIINRIDQRILVLDRLRELVKMEYIHERGKVYRISRKGHFIMNIFNAYRRLLAWGSGG